MRFFGIHEVRLFCPNRVAVGYFDNWDAALRAVESEPSQYKAAYCTLNPIKLPDGIPINPAALRSSSNAAAASDIERRVWLLIDCDPPRQSKTNSTTEEKQAARDQAERIREWLQSHGWPEPVVADSGNGWHLLYRIELPNDEASKALLEKVLSRLKQLFPMVDAGNFDAPRLCKLYGSWARKGEHSDERPWRRSAIVEEGSETIVTEQQIRALTPAPVAAPVPQKTGHAKLSSLLGFLDYYGLALRSEPREVTGGWQIEIECPWNEEHSDEARRDTVVSFIAGLGNGFKCFHSHCAGRHWRELRAEMEKRNPGLAPYFGSEPLPIIAHATLAEAFLRDNHDFVCVYDLEKRPIAQWVKTRWDISGDDTLLWRAVSDYLKGLFDQYKEPEKGPDSRKRFYDASFITGVVRCVKPYLPPVKAEVFDQNPYMLGLPDCRVIDLRTSAVRDMRREDYISQRIDVSPDPNCSTPRFDRFIAEITCGDGALANYLLRLCALCLTAIPFQALFFLWGRGRNGKGVLIRTLTAILGEGRFAWPLRPSEITMSKFGDEAMKRTFANLKGKRLVTVTESVAGNLNTSMLKLMSGGDALSGARMRQDQEVFRPTHKVLLPTNDRPQLPADPAFRGRVHMIPFVANFTGREDRQLDYTLQHVELPGILHRLITLCPDVIENGLRPPASVLAETDQLFAELDVTKQFRDDCLDSEADAETAEPDMRKAISEWLRGQAAAGLVITNGFDNQVDVVLRELRHQPGVKYVRVRRDGQRSDDGRGRVWVYVGLRLKTVQPSTS